MQNPEYVIVYVCCFKTNHITDISLSSPQFFSYVSLSSKRIEESEIK
jgi:hypothetical protein